MATYSPNARDIILFARDAAKARGEKINERDGDMSAQVTLSIFYEPETGKRSGGASAHAN